MPGTVPSRLKSSRPLPLGTGGRIVRAGGGLRVHRRTDKQRPLRPPRTAHPDPLNTARRRAAESATARSTARASLRRGRDRYTSEIGPFRHRSHRKGSLVGMGSGWRQSTHRHDSPARIASVSARNTALSSTDKPTKSASRPRLSRENAFLRSPRPRRKFNSGCGCLMVRFYPPLLHSEVI